MSKHRYYTYDDEQKFQRIVDMLMEDKKFRKRINADNDSLREYLLSNKDKIIDILKQRASVIPKLYIHGLLWVLNVIRFIAFVVAGATGAIGAVKILDPSLSQPDLEPITRKLMNTYIEPLYHSMGVVGLPIYIGSAIILLIIFYLVPALIGCFAAAGIFSLIFGWMEVPLEKFFMNYWTTRSAIKDTILRDKKRQISQTSGETL